MAPKVKALDRLTVAAARFGAVVEDDSTGESACYQICAPPGKSWKCDGPGLHYLKVEFGRSAFYRRPEMKGHESEAIKDAIRRIEHGLIDCEADCHCREEGV